jgi:acyl-CoA synthetase (AMP-forming)/AMP-acid ligase II
LKPKPVWGIEEGRVSMRPGYFNDWREMMLIQKIYMHAQNTPEKNAIVYNTTSISYRRLARAITAVRQYLSEQNFPNMGVAVLAVESRLHFWGLGLALRSLGLTTIVAPSLREIDRLRLPDIRCVVTTDAENRPDLVEFCAAMGWRLVVVPVATLPYGAAGTAPQLPDPAVRTGGHILLTSGTTGVYKKVLVEPAYEDTWFSFRRSVSELSKESVVFVSFPGWTAVGYLLPSCIWDAGGTVVIYQGDKLSEALRYPGITDVIMVPGMLASLLSSLEDGWRRNDAMRLEIGGGPLSRAMADQARQRLTRRLFTFIGATEASVITLTPVEEPDDLVWHRPLPGREVQIVDEGDQVLPAGRVGIVRVRPLPGAPGYLDDPEANRAFFREGYFYSGDLGVIDGDGRLALHGRSGDVINIMGQKLAVAPIEKNLQEALGVGGVCVFAAPDANGETVLHLVIESRRRIPQADVEAAFKIDAPRVGYFTHRVEVLPRNHMGKIQRNIVKQQLRIP